VACEHQLKHDGFGDQGLLLFCDRVEIACNTLTAQAHVPRRGGEIDRLSRGRVLLKCAPGEVRTRAWDLGGQETLN